MKTKEDIMQKHIWFELNQEGGVLIPRARTTSKYSQKNIPYAIRKIAFSNNIIPTLMGMSLQSNSRSTDFTFRQSMERAMDRLPEEIPLWMLEYQEFYTPIKDNIFIRTSAGARKRMSLKDWQERKIPVGKKTISIDGKVVRADVVLDIGMTDLKGILSGGVHSTKEIKVKTILWSYKNIRYPISLGLCGKTKDSGLIVSEYYKQLLKPDTASINRVLQYFTMDSRHKFFISNPKSIKVRDLIELFRINSLTSVEMSVRIKVASGMELRFMDIHELIKEPKNDTIIIKILDNYKKDKFMFNHYDDLVVFDPSAVKKLKDKIISYLIKEDLQIFLNDLNKLNPSLTVNKSLIDNLPKKGFIGTLQEHQKIGVSWYTELFKKGSPGAILADEMGMGKSVQTIGFLTSVMTSSSKVLIVCPASVISVWESELLKFNPTLAKKIGQNITISSYEKVSNNPPKKVDFLILDEAQKIKNNLTKSFRAISSIEKKFVCMVSGTPIENDVQDLFSLLQILNPSAYDLLYILKRAYGDQHDLVAALRDLVNPIYLQRKKTKEHLTASLTVNEIMVPSSKFELNLQSEIKKIFKDKMIKEKATNNHDFYSMVALTGLMRLRQGVSFPDQFPQEFKDHFSKKMQLDINNIQPSKLTSTVKLCKDIKTRGEKVVIFGIFSGAILGMKKKLEGEGLKVLSFTGSDSSTKRKILIEEFQKPGSIYDVFIISLKAGNSGITLTAANNVIVYDLWYNPAVVSQAIARVHRIGQAKDVNAYLLILENTIDVSINNIFLNKNKLIEKFSGTPSKEIPKNSLTELSKEMFK